MSRLWRFVLALLIVAPLLAPRPASAAGPLDYAIPNGHFYTQANGQGGEGGKGYTITDDESARFWSEFKRLGGVDVLGYPASHRFEWDGFKVQVTQRVVMQWRPEVGQVYFVNVFDRLHDLGKDAWLDVVRAIPPPFDTTPDTGLSWEQVKERHWRFLDQNEAIKRVYWSDSDPLQHYGLPMSYKDYGNVFVVRAQRAVFQYWKEDVPWARKGQVTIALGGDIAKEAGVFPIAAVTPGRWPRDAGLRWAYWVDYDPQSLASLKEHAREMDYVSPVYFSVDGEGNITGEDRVEVSHLIRSAGARLVPTVKNSATGQSFTAVLAPGSRRQRVIAELERLVIAHNYDGVAIDFEDLYQGDGGVLSEFVGELSARLRARGRLTAVAVVARTEDAFSSWSAPYDYAALSRYADLVILMAYGYRTSRSSIPGPAAPLPWVEATLAYALKRVPAEKLILGVAWYGYDWNVTKGGRAAALRYSDALALARRYNVPVQWGAFSQSPYFRYTSEGQVHEVWFEDAESFRLRLELARRYGLAGVSGWRLGHEDPAVWRVWGEAGS